MQFWSVSPQNGLKMCAFLWGIMCATSPNQSSCVVWKACNRNHRSGPVWFSVFFSVAWTRPADTSHMAQSGPKQMTFCVVWAVDKSFLPFFLMPFNPLFIYLLAWWGPQGLNIFIATSTHVMPVVSNNINWGWKWAILHKVGPNRQYFASFDTI